MIELRRRMHSREAQKAKLLSRQYEQLQEIWTENAMLFHDMENHLRTIRYLAEEGKTQELLAYLARISHPMERLSEIQWTGIGIVDAVINEKKRLARERGCELEINVQLPGNTGIAEDDFCTILTNLLDNAIESAGDKEDTGNQIRLVIRQIRHFLIIQVSNPCPVPPAGGKGIFITRKEDRHRHGWGLKSVRRAVGRYEGSLSCQVEDGRFTATVLLFFKPLES